MRPPLHAGEGAAGTGMQSPSRRNSYQSDSASTADGIPGIRAASDANASRASADIEVFHVSGRGCIHVGNVLGTRPERGAIGLPDGVTARIGRIEMHVGIPAQASRGDAGSEDAW